MGPAVVVVRLPVFRLRSAHRQLDVVPDAPAYGTKLRWSSPKLIARVKGAAVHTIHVLAPGCREGRPDARPWPGAIG